MYQPALVVIIDCCWIVDCKDGMEKIAMVRNVGFYRLCNILYCRIFVSFVLNTIDIKILTNFT